MKPETKGVIPIQKRKRYIQIIVRVTEQERALIEEIMKQLPTQNLSAYARKMLIDGCIILLDIPEIKIHSAQLQKIGGNLNQIARRINDYRQGYVPFGARLSESRLLHGNLLC